MKNLRKIWELVRFSNKNRKERSSYIHQEKLEFGARDFARRFEGVMRDLANG
jgi:hypothetical protein